MELLKIYSQSGLFGSVMIVLILLLRLFLKQAPRKYLCFLWLIAALRLLLPFHLESAVSLQPQYIEPEMIVSVEESTVSSEPVFQPQTVPVTDPIVREDPVTSVNPEQILPIIWLAVGCSLLAYGILSYGYLKHRVHHAVKRADGVMESDRIAGGFLLGYFNSKIYIPTDLSEQDRSLIIAHEQVHKARGDHWWKLFGFLCCCVHWYNPLVWVGYWLLCRDIEIACDESVVQNMDLEQRKAYSLALLNCGKRLSGFLVCPVAFGEVSLKQRIKNVLSYRRSGMVITAVTIALAAFVAVCFLTSPVTEPECSTVVPTESSPSTEPTEPTIRETEPVTDATEPTEPTIRETEPVTDATVPTEPTIRETEPVTDATVPTTAPEAVVTKPATVPTTTTQTTEPPVTKPTVTTPAQSPADDSGNVIAQGKWDGGPVQWKIDADGTLTITGNNSIQGATDYVWKEYSDIVTKIVVDDGIISIPKEAFRDMIKVTEVYLGKKLNRIEEAAFMGCTALKSISIPAQVGQIKRSTFCDCPSLRTVKFAKYCQVECIEAYAFANSGLTSFTCPDSLSQLDATAFSGCSSLQYYESKEGIFRGTSLCDGKKFLAVNGLESVELYGDTTYSFADCKNLKSVSILGNRKEISNGMFQNCTSLVDVTIQSPITKIEGYAFQGCASLRSVTIPNTVTEIGIRAFAGTGISKIIIPPSVKEMGWCVFEDSKLSQIEFQGDIPKFINNSTFSGASVTACYPADNPSWTEDLLKNYGGKITWLPL